MPTRILLNTVAADASGADPLDTPSREPLEFHRRLPGYGVTPLLRAPKTARRLGVREVWVKDESRRLTMPSYKILGASWAIYRILRDQLDVKLNGWQTVDDLRDAVAPLRPLSLVAATDGNHGRAVARMAHMLGLSAQILVPADMVSARIAAIESEGATVTVIDGSYDLAVERSAALEGQGNVVVSDTAWEGYADVPKWVVEGYSTLFWEIDDALHAAGEHSPGLVAVQIGVGSLAAAVVRHHKITHTGTTVLGVEPTRAACVISAVAAGRAVTVPPPHDSIMAGLNCGVASPLVLPLLTAGIEVFAAIDDDAARDAMRDLAAQGVTSGESGAAGVAGLIEVLTGHMGDAVRAALRIDENSSLLVISTEGATDPDAYATIVGGR